MPARDPQLDRQIKSLIKKLRKVAPIEVARANAKALNTVTRSTRSRVVAGVAKQTRVKQKDLRRRAHATRATAKKQSAKLTSYVRPVPAVKLLTKNQIERRLGTGTNRRGVRARGYDWPGAFIQPGARQNVQVFRRKGSSRYPIDVVDVPVEKPFERGMKTVPKRVMKARYRQVLQHELGFRLKKLNAR